MRRIGLQVGLVLAVLVPAALGEAEDALPTQNVYRVLSEVKSALADVPVRVQWMEAATGRLTMRVAAADKATLAKVGPALKKNDYLKSRATVPARGFVRRDVEPAGKLLQAEIFLHFKRGAGPTEPRGETDPRAEVDRAGKEVGLRVRYALRVREKVDEAAKRRWFKHEFQLEAVNEKTAEPTLRQLESLLERIGTKARMQLTFVAWYRAKPTAQRPDPGDALERARIQITTWAPLTE